MGIEIKDILNNRSRQEGVSSSVISEALEQAMKEAGIARISHFAPVYGGAVSVRVFSDEDNSHPEMVKLPRAKTPSEIASELVLMTLRNEARHPSADGTLIGKKIKAKSWILEVADIQVGGRILPVVVATASRSLPK